MSSFVISKSEYTRAAAFLSAFVSVRDHFNDPHLYVWCKRKNRPATGDDILSDFVRLYEINARSVADQYGEPAHIDPTDYREAWDDMCLRMAFLIGHRDEQSETLCSMVHGLIEFFSSVQYQIEGDEYTRRALNILNKYYRAIYSLLRMLNNIDSDTLSDYWGHFRLPE